MHETLGKTTMKTPQTTMVCPKLFLDTNVCINVANETIPRDEWQKVRKHIQAHYSYQISYVTLKELFAKITRGENDYFEENKKPLHVLCELPQQEFLPYPPVFALRTVLELKSVARGSLPVPEEELRRAKDQLKGSLMLSLESSTARMSNLARQEMYFDRFYGLDELIEHIEAVTAEDLKQTADEFFRTDQIAVTVLGNLNGLKLTREQLVC